MAIDNMRNTTFDNADFQQWKNLAVQSLKGKPYEKLMTSTYEGITLQPLYYENVKSENTLAIQQMKGNCGWTIAQQTFAENGNAFLEQLESSLERGNESIVYDGTASIAWTEEELIRLSSHFTNYPVYLFNTRSEDPILRAFDFVHHEVRQEVQGIVQTEDWTIPVGFDNVRTAGVDLWKIHHEGADAVTELAVALSQASKLATNSASFQSFVKNFYVRFAVDTHFFMEIAKLRAFRILWKAFSKAFDVDETPSIPVFAVTSIRSFSKLDPHVNLLRAGNETFAAILGGGDIIMTHPHNILTGPNASSIRYSRNIQLVLKEETHVEKVLDSAGGSYFIEKLTNELVEKAWNLFLEIENDGGADILLKKDALQKQLDKRKKELAIGKKNLIGTTAYADLINTNFDDWSGIEAVHRLAEPFEVLRKQFNNDQPKTIVLTFGLLKDFKPRADFVTSFLATGGIHSKWSPIFNATEQAVEWIKREEPDYVIVSALDETVTVIMDELLDQLPKEIIIDVAGKYNEEIEQKWKEKGLNGTIFNGQDKIDKLQSIYDLWKGGRCK